MHRRLLVVSLLVLRSTAEDVRSVLGPVVHTLGAVHELNRTSLLDELRERKAPHNAADSDDVLRIKLYDARARLLEHRNQHVMHAQTVTNEVAMHSSAAILADWSVDTLLTDDNAIFVETLSRGLLWDLKVRTVGGAIVGLALARFAPLGRIAPSMLPTALRVPSASKTAMICAVTSAMMALLQYARHHVLRIVGDPSYFGQKITAVCCREGVFEWVQQVEDIRASAGGGDGAAAGSRESLFSKRGVAVPILLLSTGSSIFEEVAFRAIFLHAMVTKLRLGPNLAMAISSIVFGAAHIANEKSRVHQVVYACWTFIGGLIFGGAYLGTHGGLLVPTLLHFGNNAAVFAASLDKVAKRMLTQRRGYMAVAERVRAQQLAKVQELKGGAGGRAGAPPQEPASVDEEQRAAQREENARLRERLQARLESSRAGGAQEVSRSAVAAEAPERFLDELVVVPVGVARAVE